MALNPIEDDILGVANPITMGKESQKAHWLKHKEASALKFEWVQDTCGWCRY